MPQLEGKVIIVTNAASPAGRSIASALVAEGARVVAASEPADTPESAASLAGEAIERFGRLDALVNAPTPPARASVAEVDEAAWEQAYRALVRTAFCVTKAAAPRIADSGGGSIVDVGSTAGLFGRANAAAHSTATAALAQFTRLIAVELRDSRISANYVAVTEEGEGADESQVVPSLVAFLCSDAGREISGQTFFAGGGAFGLVSNYAASATVSSPSGAWTPEELRVIAPSALGLRAGG